MVNLKKLEKKLMEEKKIVTPEMRFFISKMDMETRRKWIEQLSPQSRKKFLKEWFEN